jgi:soluble lytic murein transglycosylase-like protein
MLRYINYVFKTISCGVTWRTIGSLAVATLLVLEPAFSQSVVTGQGAQASPYRLQLGSDDAYRLSAGYRPAVAPSPLSHLPYAAQVETAARASSLDPALVHALISVESGHRQDARSPKGATGLMQLMPGTAQRYGVRAPEKSPEENLSAGTRYLRDLLGMFENRLDLALAAYNAGEGAVMKYGNRIPPYRETRNYVPAVMEKYKEWQVKPPDKPLPLAYLPGTRLDDKALLEFRSRSE